MLLAITLQQRPLAVVVMAVAAAITTGVWFITLLYSEAWLQRAMLIWAALVEAFPYSTQAEWGAVRAGGGADDAQGKTGGGRAAGQSQLTRLTA